MRRSLWFAIVLSQWICQSLAQLDSIEQSIGNDSIGAPVNPFYSSQEPKVVPVTFTFPSLDPARTDISFSLFQSTMSECSASVENDDTGSLVWGPSVALTQYLVQHPNHVAGKTVWELGSGGGALPSLVSYRLGATQVVATDFQESTLQLTQSHAIQNNCPIQVQSMDWQDVSNTHRLVQQYDGTPDVVLAADVIYGLTMVPPLIETLNVILGPQSSLILAIRQGREGLAEFRQGMEQIGCTEIVLEAFLDASYLPDMPPVFAEDPLSRDRWSGNHSIWMYQR